MKPTKNEQTRREALQAVAALGVGGAVFQRALAAQSTQKGPVTPEMIQQAEWIAGIELSPDARKSLVQALSAQVREFGALRQIKVDNSVPPVLQFMPSTLIPSGESGRGHVEVATSIAPERPGSIETLAFLPIAELASLIRSRKISSMELTKLYLDRLTKADKKLFCVVSLTEKIALEQAQRADRELAAGIYRGPLHGIPWGAKDLIAYPGYKTTWGAAPYRDQTLNTKATVAKRLEDAGAVLLAKLTLGALAQGDRWFGGITRNPWNPTQGSSGSSAGSSSATAAGLVGFAIGSETLGSIVSPCLRCGVTGLRPTFGRVSRHGCMTLSWSMDKIGPICRTVEDAAIVFGAIHGSDGLDPCAVDRPFNWPCPRDLRLLRVGYTPESVKRPELDVLRDLGVTLVPFELPAKYPLAALRQILTAEAATAFDDATRQNITEPIDTWIRSFRAGQLISAVDYLRANRVRTLVFQEMEETLSRHRLDAYFGGNDLLLTNLTGHPTVVLPTSVRKIGSQDVPQGATFTGRLFGETELLAVAHAYQRATGFHLLHPAGNYES